MPRVKQLVNVKKSSGINHLSANNQPSTDYRQAFYKKSHHVLYPREWVEGVRELSTFGFDSLSLSGFSDDVTKPPGF